MNRFRTPRLLMVAAIGTALAMLALPSFAAARAGGHHHANRHAKHHRAHRRILIHGTASNTAGSPTAGSPVEQENAGEVESFDGTTLTIKLFAGGTVSGKVTESTEIECEHQGTEAQASEDGQDNQGEEDQQSGDQSSGDQSQQSGDQSQQSEDQSGDEEDSSDTEDQTQSSSSCGTAALVPGAIVHEAELDVSSAGAVFHSVHLAS